MRKCGYSVSERAHHAIPPAGDAHSDSPVLCWSQVLWDLKDQKELMVQREKREIKDFQSRDLQASQGSKVSSGTVFT